MKKWMAILLAILILGLSGCKSSGVAEEPEKEEDTQPRIEELSEEEMAELRALDDSKCQLIISIDSEDYAKITNPTYFPQNNKKQMVFRFYRYSEGRSYMTINGEGEFFVDASFVEKMLADAKRLEDGILIDSTAKN